MTLQNVKNCTTKYLNDSEIGEISTIKLKRMMTRMTDEMKEYINMYKHLNKNKGNTNNQQNEFKGEHK
jgi:hypothetical protein